jgi:molybdate transport system ATP-binding protein
LISVPSEMGLSNFSASKDLERVRTAPGALQVRLGKRLATSFELDVNFSLEPGITILFGASGAGKTTLLDCLAGLTTSDSGHISNFGRTLFDSEKGIHVAPRHRKIGYVFQDVALFPHLSVGSNVGYGLSHLSSRERKQKVSAALDGLGIQGLGPRRPSQLSGGERQRVALARALVTEPSLLLLDEPLAALDLPVRMKVADDLRRAVQGLAIPVIYVTHSRDEVFMLGEKLLVLERGKVIAQGTPHEVLSAPRSETVAQLAGFENVFDVEVTSVHEDRGTMTCRVAVSRTADPQGSEVERSVVELETPLVRAERGDRLSVGISAGDILLATSEPIGLSARNTLGGRVVSLSRRDMVIEARVDCGVELAVHLTLGARDSLGLAPGRQVWVIIKTHSCHLLARDS